MNRIDTDGRNKKGMLRITDKMLSSSWHPRSCLCTSDLMWRSLYLLFPSFSWSLNGSQAQKQPLRCLNTGSCSPSISYRVILFSNRRTYTSIFTSSVFRFVRAASLFVWLKTSDILYKCQVNMILTRPKNVFLNRSWVC